MECGHQQETSGTYHFCVTAAVVQSRDLFVGMYHEISLAIAGLLRLIEINSRADGGIE